MNTRIIETEHHNAFRPLTIAITFETQDELDAFAGLFNYSPICYAMKQAGAERSYDLISELLSKNGADCQRKLREIRATLENSIKH